MSQLCLISSCPFLPRRLNWSRINVFSPFFWPSCKKRKEKIIKIYVKRTDSIKEYCVIFNWNATLNDVYIRLSTWATWSGLGNFSIYRILLLHHILTMHNLCDYLFPNVLQCLFIFRTLQKSLFFMEETVDHKSDFLIQLSGVWCMVVSVMSVMHGHQNQLLASNIFGTDRQHTSQFAATWQNVV